MGVVDDDVGGVGAGEEGPERREVGEGVAVDHQRRGDPLRGREREDSRARAPGIAPRLAREVVGVLEQEGEAEGPRARPDEVRGGAFEEAAFAHARRSGVVLVHGQAAV